MGTDHLSPEQRKRNMQAVRASGSKIEKLLDDALQKKGIQYQKNCGDILGRPDIAFPRFKIVVFCDSEFWHGYDWENRKNDFHSNREFWWKKIEGNIQRDRYVTKILEEQGWVVLRFWGKDIKYHLDDCIDYIEKAIAERSQPFGVSR